MGSYSQQLPSLFRFEEREDEEDWIIASPPIARTNVEIKRRPTRTYSVNVSDFSPSPTARHAPKRISSSVQVINELESFIQPAARLDPTFATFFGDRDELNEREREDEVIISNELSCERDESEYRRRTIPPTIIPTSSLSTSAFPSQQHERQPPLRHLSPASIYNQSIRRSKTPTRAELSSFFGGISFPCPTRSIVASVPKPPSQSQSQVVTSGKKRKPVAVVESQIAETVAARKQKQKLKRQKQNPTPAPIPPATQVDVSKPVVLANLNHCHQDRSAIPAPTITVPPSPIRAKSPTLAEMDAFFGYNAAVDPPVIINCASSNLARDLSQVQQTEANEKRSAIAKRAVMIVIDEADRARQSVARMRNDTEIVSPVYQLSAIDPSLSSDAKRLAIIASLENITLSIFKQLLDSVDSAPASRDANVDMQGGNIEKIAARVGKQKGKVKKFSPVVVVLVKRAGVKYDPNNVDHAPATRRIIFPRRSLGNKEARCGSRELAAFLKTIELIIDGLKRRVIVTKRDLFYRSVALFSQQATVDNIVEDIAATLGVRRSDLNVVAASKGLFIGNLKIVGIDGSILEGGSQGALIPPTQAIDRLECDNVSWILIVEKEAVFKTLSSPSFLQNCELSRGIVLTGKGYPDVATRELVKRLSDVLPLVPILALVDSDPHGFEIMSTYKFGSAALAFDKSNLSVDRIEWLGIKGSEWDALGVDRKELLEFGKGDRRKAIAMLKRDWWPEDWRKELAFMLHLGKKAEIQILSSIVPSSLSIATTSDAFSTLADLTSDLPRTPLLQYLVRKINDRLSR